MKVILLKDVAKLGRKFEIKDVSDGYGRNVLISKGFALAATAENLGKVKQTRDNYNTALKNKKDTANKVLEEIGDLEIHLGGKASEEGHLFAAIHKSEIVRAVKEASGLMMEESWIGEKALKEVGEQLVPINIDGQKTTLKIIVERI